MQFMTITGSLSQNLIKPRDEEKMSENEMNEVLTVYLRKTRVYNDKTRIPSFGSQEALAVRRRRSSLRSRLGGMWEVAEGKEQAVRIIKRVQTPAIQGNLCPWASL